MSEMAGFGAISGLSTTKDTTHLKNHRKQTAISKHIKHIYKCIHNIYVEN